jgi:hypothetical protein
MQQLTNDIIMIRPACFGYNAETAVNNSFQTEARAEEQRNIQQKALEEFDNMTAILREKGINVQVIEDTPEPQKPDAVFPNNWISLHENGTVITYPMWAKNRRIERRSDIFDILSQTHKIQNKYSFDFYEEEDLFLEGTGSMIFDRQNGIVYACLSPRTDVTLIDKFNLLLKTRSFVFDALDSNEKPIYHTNVMMALGENFVVICLECIPDETQKKTLIQSFEDTGKTIVEISLDQVNQFAGNMLEVLGSQQKKYLVMSATAYASLRPDQIEVLSGLTNILPIPIPTIETYGGGSVRCMMAENFLPKKR